MAGNLSEEDDEITGINVTPLVDVMLVLLIIFMVTASYIVHRSIAVKLPTAATGELQQSTKNLAFVIDSSSNLYLDGKKISYFDLGVYIKNISNEMEDKSTKLQALISADVSAPHGSVVKLIDFVRKNGINEFAINVESATGN